MPTVGTPSRQIRVPDDLWQEFKRACEDAGTNRSAALVEFMTWYVGRSSKRPERPR